MPLRITLKPHERLIISGAVMTNGNSPARFLVDNKVPILREKDIMSEKDVDTPAKRIYFLVQLMYIDQENLKDHHGRYWRLVRDYIQAAPGTIGLFRQISNLILADKYYQALKTIRSLIEYEKVLLSSSLEESPPLLKEPQHEKADRGIMLY